MKHPLDTTPYPKDPRSRPISSRTSPGLYAYVQDAQGVIWVVPDGPHVHPKILGGGLRALYAGDLTIGPSGDISDLTNLSGTFQFYDEDGLKAVAAQLRQQGCSIAVGAVGLFPADGSPPVVVE